MDDNGLKSGEIFEGKWRVDHELGRGGFATVYAAEELTTGRQVALKLLRQPEGGYPDDIARRFRRELRAIGELRCPHTVTMYSGGESSTGLFYAVFEQIDGMPLSRMLRERGRLTTAEVRTVLSQLLEALDEAHRHGVLHRDLKPENVLVLPGAPLRAKLIDFGLARPLDVNAPSVTQTGELIGTPRYMSPEQLTERPLTPSSDLYSLGLIAFEMLMGRDALHGNAWSDQLDRLHSGHVFSLPALQELEELDDVIRKLSARDPAARYQSAAQVRSALDGASEPEEPLHEDSSRWPMGVGLTAIVLVLLGVYVLSASTEEEHVRVLSTGGGMALTRTEPAEPTIDQPQAKPPAEPRLSSGCEDPSPSATGAHFTIHVPPGDAGVPRPLIMFLHDRGDPAGASLRATRWSAIGDEAGVIVVAPHTVEVPQHTDPWKHPDQIARARAVLDAVGKAHCINLDELYLVGNGFGVFGAERLMCSTDWAGVALYGALGHTPFERCPNRDPGDLRVLKMIGRDDPMTSLWGAPTKCTGVPTKRDWVGLDARWAEKLEADTDDPMFSEDESTDRCRTWSRDDRSVYRSCLWRGGHRWPGFEPRPQSKVRNHEVCDGPAPPDVEIEQFIWDFFTEGSDRAMGSEGCYGSPLPPARPSPPGMRMFVAGRDDRGPVPLVALFHDRDVPGRLMHDESGFKELAEREGFLLATFDSLPPLDPGGVAGPWTEREVGPRAPAVTEFLQWVLQTHCVDERRIYVVGHGEGGHGAERMACHPMVDGVATVSHIAKPAGEKCEDGTPRKIPRITFVPLDSKHHPVFGGTGCGGVRVSATLNSRNDATAEAYGCVAGDPAFRKGSDRRRRTWSCPPGTAFESRLVDGGHPWPGLARTRADPCDGADPEIDYAVEIWQFFDAVHDGRANRSDERTR